MRFLKKLVATGLALGLISVSANAQPITDAQGDVGIGTFNPHPSALLDLTSTSKGFLVPRMTTAQRNAIVAPADALMIFNTSTRDFEYYDANLPGWTTFGVSGGPFWRLDGNIGTTPWNGVIGNFLGTRDAQNLVIATTQNNEIQIWTNNTQRAVVSNAGDVGIGEATPSARLDVVGDNANPAVEVTNNGVIGVQSTVDGGSGLILASYPAVRGDGSGETGVAGTSDLGVGVFAASNSNHGLNGLSLGAGVAGVFGRNDQPGGFGVIGQSFATATGVYGNSDAGISGRFENANAANGSNTFQVDNNGAGNAVQINATGGGVGIDLNGGELDGDDQGNALGDGSANQQLTVRGTADAVIGNTLGANPTVWDQVIQGDVVATGIIKGGGSIWIDGVTPGNHQVTADDVLNVGTLGNDDLTLSTNSTNAVVIDGTTQDVNILNNLNVAGNGDVSGSFNVDGPVTFNSTLDVDGVTDLHSNLNVDGPTDLNSTLNVDGASTFNNTITQLGGGQVSFSGNVDAQNGLDVTGADLTVGGALFTVDVTTGNTDIMGTLNVDGTITGNSAGNVLGDNTNSTILTIDGDGGGAAPYELVVDGDAQIAGLLGLPALTPGSVTFIDGANNLAEDNPNFFWDDAANELGLGNNTPSARLDVVGDNANPAVEATNNGVVGVESTVDGGSGIILATYPAVHGDANTETGVAGTSGTGLGVYGSSNGNNGILGVASTPTFGGVMGRNDVAGGFGVIALSLGAGTGITATSSTGTAGIFTTTAGAANTVQIDDASTGDALEVNANAGSVGIDLNGGELDGDDQGNALGDGSANQQLTVRGTADAVIGNTLGANPTVWDQVIQGDVVATGIIKGGGSIWIDGVSPGNHTIVADDILSVGTLGTDNLSLSTNSTPAVVVDGATQDVNILNNLDVDGDLNADGNTTLDNTTIDGTLTQNAGQVTLNGNVDATNGLDVSGADLNVATNADITGNLNVDGITTLDETTVDGTFDQTGGGQVTISGNVDANNGLDVSGADLNVATNADITGNLNVDGITTLDETTVDGTFDQTGGGQVTISGNVDATNGLDVSGADLTVATNAAVTGNATVNGIISGTSAGNSIGSGADAEQLQINGVDGGAVEVDINGDVDISGTLTVGSFPLPPLSSDLDMNGFNIVDNIDGEVRVDDNFNVTGNTDLDGNLLVNGSTVMDATLTVMGNTILDANTTVNGNSTLNGATTINGTSTFNASSIWGGGNDITLNNGTFNANKTAAGSAIAINNTNGTNAIALNVTAGGGRTILSYGSGLGVIPTDVSVWNATGNVTLPGSVENGQILYVVNSSGGAIVVTGVTGGTAAAFNNNDVRSYVYAGGWYEMP